MERILTLSDVTSQKVLTPLDSDFPYYFLNTDTFIGLSTFKGVTKSVSVSFNANIGSH